MAEQGVEKTVREAKSAVKNSIEHLHGPEEVHYGVDELVVLCLVRNGRPYVKSFVEHYFSLGVKHIVFMDNGSTDGTVDAARKYENVTVLRTRLPFKDYQKYMKHYMIERFARGRWSLSVDIDELFDYPFSDVVSLSSFLRYLGERSYTAVVTQMLDMFPESPVTDSAVELEDEPLKERHRFYDISNVHAYDYSEHRRTGGSANSLANGEISVYRDGIKKTVFPNTEPILTKHALVFLDGKVRPMDGSVHKITNARIADVSCVLFHYKFLNNFYEFVRQAVRQENYMKGSRKHKLWMETLSRSPSLQVKGETARELESVNDLVHNRFLVVSREYLALVDREDRERYEPTPRGQSETLIEAYFKLRAESEIQIREAEHSRQTSRGSHRGFAWARVKDMNLRAKLESLKERAQNLSLRSDGWLRAGIERLRLQVSRRSSRRG